MQKHRKLKARILSLALSVAMVTSMMPATVLAAEGDDVTIGASSVGEIKSFDKLESRFIPGTGEGASPNVYALSVELDTAEADLNLPTELTAMVARTTVVTEDEDIVDSGKVDEPAEDEIIPDEGESDEPAKDETIPDEDIDDTVSGNQPASPSDAEEKADVETTVTITESETIAVTWNSNKTFTSEQKGGPFIYTAELPKDYILTDSVKLPQIYVFVGNKQGRSVPLSHNMSSDSLELTSDDGCAADAPHTVTGTATDGKNITVTSGTHFVELGGVSITRTADEGGVATPAIELSDGTTLNLSLKDGTSNTLTGAPGIAVVENSVLIIDGTGSLAVSGTTDTGTAAIGQKLVDGNGVACGDITINGGNITATGTAWASAIGMSAGGDPNGTLTVNGGTIIAKAGNEADHGSVSVGTITLKTGMMPKYYKDNSYIGEVITKKSGDVLYAGGILYERTPGDTNGSTSHTPAKDVQIKYETPDYSVAVAAQSGTLTYGNTRTSATFAVTASNFVITPTNVNYTIKWYTNAAGTEGETTTVPTGLNFMKTDASTLTATVGATANAGTYYFKLTAKTGFQTATSDVVTLTVDQKTYSGTKTASTSVKSGETTTNATLTLPPPPTGASYAASGTLGGTTALISSHSVSGSTLTFTTTSQADNTSATITIPVTGATNYKDYDVVVTVTAKAKESVTISGLTAATSLVYNGNTQSGYTGTVTVSEGKVPTNELVYTYSGVSSTNYGPSTTAPTNTGSYKLVVSVAENNANYSGTHADILFSIGKKEVTVAAGSYKVSKGFDGTTAAGTGSGTLSVTGILLPTDSGVTVTPDTIPAYSGSAVGASYTIALPISISGDTNGNYKIKNDATTVNVPGEITTASVTVMVDTIAAQNYTGSQITPTPTVKVNGAAIADTNYNLEYGTNIDAGTNAGSVTIKAKAGGNYTFSNVTSNFTINKVNYNDAAVTGSHSVIENTAASNVEFDLSTLTFPAGFKDKSFASVSIGTNTDGVLTGTPTISGNKVKFNVTSQVKNKSGVLNVVVSSKNYNDYTVAITVTTVDKKPVTITAAVASKTYDGSAVTQPIPTAVETAGGASATIAAYDYQWQESSDNGSTYTNISAAPKDAGTYRLVVSVPSNNATYTGSKNVDFTIYKATVTIAVKDKTANVGDPKPPFSTSDYTVSGLASGETLKTAPTLSYATEPDMSKTGTYTINATSAVVPDGGNYETTIIYTTGTLTVKKSGGGGSGGGSSSGGSSGGSTTTPSTKPTAPVQGSTNAPATVDPSGNASTTVTDKNISDAIANAKTEASKKGVNAGEITAVINVATNGKDANTVTVNLPKTTQQQVINNKIDNVALVIEKPDISISLNLATIQEINKQANADVQLTATRIDTSKLSGEAKAAIGNRPTFDLKATYANGSKAVTNFGTGSVSVAIPYTLQAGEVAGGLYAVYVDGNGKANYITGSSYDTNAKMLRFATNHFSVYGIGYKTPVAFTDIAGHWAKTDIEFVFNRGLMSGTTNTTFSPYGAMTRGMFVTALGRLASVNPADYKAVVYTDVEADAYYAPYVAWAKANNITNGTTATTFSPDDIVTRQEMAVFMSNYAKAMGYKVPQTRDANTFADNASIATWAAAAVKQMQMAGVLNGKNGNQFDPTGTATRAEVAAVLHRYVSLVIDRVTTQGLDTNDSGSAIMYENGKMVKSASRTVGSTIYNFNANGEATAAVPTAPAALPADNKKTGTYTVQKGDSFWLIAQKVGCTMSELEQLNGKSRYDIIYVGQVMKVPVQ